MVVRHRGPHVHRGILGTAHHYYWIGVPSYWLVFGGFFSALEPLAFLGMAMYAYMAMRRSGLAHPNRLALHWTIGSAIFSALGAGVLGLAHTWPSVNKWTHGTMITAMHGHMAFFGAYVMIVLAIITYAAPALFGHEEDEAIFRGSLGVLAPDVGMFGMTMAFATAGISQTYLERIMGLGYLETQQWNSGAYHSGAFGREPGCCSCLGWACTSTTSSSSPPGGRRRSRDAPRGPRSDGFTRRMTEQRVARRTPLTDGLRQPGGREPFYIPLGDERVIFEECHARGLGVMLKGPCGCSRKTRCRTHGVAAQLACW